MKLFEIGYHTEDSNGHKLIVCENKTEANAQLEKWIEESYEIIYGSYVDEIDRVEGYKISLSF